MSGRAGGVPAARRAAGRVGSELRIRAAEERLRQMGLEAEAPVFAAHDLEPALDARARGLWQGKALSKAYAATRQKLSVAEIGALDGHAVQHQDLEDGRTAIR